MVANKIFHALGYWRVEYQLAEIRPESLAISPKSRLGRVKPRKPNARSRDSPPGAAKPDGCVPDTGEPADSRDIVGGFRYDGTRTIPNDVVPHEHRRELRALRVFGAWTNLVDMKAGNARRSSPERPKVVRHYLQDVGPRSAPAPTGRTIGTRATSSLWRGRLRLKRLSSRLLSPSRHSVHGVFPLGRF
jgi:hypothetical protein